ncbi:hypothetical protein GCM10010965_21490 [Caldalkalibacillus thermarum]|uniref:M28 family peptidase n=1 Tax=Caldalkalibacillus thermarum TaxID=296745 RepID=UPI001667222F|nr:M28 family peptidase [Caldalkalibacillus thermarum]GGK28327.1 hypothetical protein GCM10010965_21490 [Caldalkalibacillus thermarum]
MNTEKLLARYGFQLSDGNKEGRARESHAGRLLNETLAILRCKQISQLSTVAEQEWVTALKQASAQVKGPGKECLVDPRQGELPLSDIDLYMRGIVRWLNALGIYTTYSCDGHGKKRPYVYLLNTPTVEQQHLMTVCTLNEFKLFFRGKKVSFDVGHDVENVLLRYAERLYDLARDRSALKRLEAEQFKQELIELLNVPGESGREQRIRHVVVRKLRPLANELAIDQAGNVLATIDCGDGPTVLLSAHMDIYQELDEDRIISQNGTVLSSSKGILGADDRAGITVILNVCRRIRQTDFKGKLKIAFTVKEEIGLIGARRIEPAFLEDVNAAIVVDRRGTRDIVTSCYGTIPYCTEEYGRIFEKAGELAGQDGWKMTAGGSSDARVFAEMYRINTVNLSVGFQNEHTDRETLDYYAAFETAQLIQTVLHHQLITKIQALCTP